MTISIFWCSCFYLNPSLTCTHAQPAVLEKRDRVFFFCHHHHYHLQHKQRAVWKKKSYNVSSLIKPLTVSLTPALRRWGVSAVARWKKSLTSSHSRPPDWDITKPILHQRGDGGSHDAQSLTFHLCMCARDRNDRLDAVRSHAVDTATFPCARTHT